MNSNQKKHEMLKKSKMVDLSPIVLNVNGLLLSKQKVRLDKHDPTICCPQETNFVPKDTNRLKMKAWKTIFHANSNQKRARVGYTSIRKNRL